jgi:hypothetical protein
MRLFSDATSPPSPSLTAVLSRRFQFIRILSGSILCAKAISLSKVILSCRMPNALRNFSPQFTWPGHFTTLVFLKHSVFYFVPIYPHFPTFYPFLLMLGDFSFCTNLEMFTFHKSLSQVIFSFCFKFFCYSLLQFKYCYGLDIHGS